jgi:DNA replicative helicase MCM subunit Mcm2 (Cdc46/Mcm family)
VRLQARTQSLAMGAMPTAMSAILQDDLVDCCQPGGAT